MTISQNQGVIVTGGSFHATNAAVGSGAQVHQLTGADAKAAEDAQKQLASFMELLKLHQEQIPNAAEVKEASHSVAEELAKEKPNRLTLKSLLTGITDSVKSVGSLAVAAEALKVTVVTLLGL